MARKKSQDGAMTADYHETPEGPVTSTQPPNDLEQAFSEAGLNEEHEQAEPPRSRKWGERTAPTRARQSSLKPFQTYPTPDNKVHLSKNDFIRNDDGTQGAFFINFDVNPNEGRAKDDPHPVINFLKNEVGVSYKKASTDVRDNTFAWKLPYSKGRWSVRQEMDAKDVAVTAANMLGANLEAAQGQSR